MDLGSAPRFSIVVLARNEEWSLPHLLYSLEGFRERGGELVLMDSGSTDDTIAIARRRGCRIEAVNAQFDLVLDSAQAAQIEERFAKAGEGPLVQAGRRLFNFGEARQHAGFLASNPFVLQLDASDEVVALDIDAFDGQIGSEGVSAFEYNQQYGNVGLRIARFYDRSRYHWEGRVHEVLLATVRADVAPASRIRCDPKQLLVNHNVEFGKPRNYMAGLALQVLDSPQKPRWWHFLGRELLYERWYESAIAALEVHAEMGTAWLTERSQSLCFIGECLEALGRAGEAKESYRRAFALDPTRREPLLRLASICSRQGEFDAAAHLARQSLEIPRTNAYPELDANYTWFPHSLLYWSLFWLHRREEARVHWDAYRSLVPEEIMIREHARLFPPAGVPARAALPLRAAPDAASKPADPRS
jgi:tetratricopeptide (TPR) repeat protein